MSQLLFGVNSRSFQGSLRDALILYVLHHIIYSQILLYIFLICSGLIYRGLAQAFIYVLHPIPQATKTPIVTPFAMAIQLDDTFTNQSHTLSDKDTLINSIHHGHTTQMIPSWNNLVRIWYRSTPPLLDLWSFRSLCSSTFMNKMSGWPARGSNILNILNLSCLRHTT